MAQFPKAEADVVALANAMVAGYGRKGAGVDRETGEEEFLVLSFEFLVGGRHARRERFKGSRV